MTTVSNIMVTMGETLIGEGEADFETGRIEINLFSDFAALLQTGMDTNVKKIAIDHFQGHPVDSDKVVEIQNQWNSYLHGSVHQENT